MYVFREINPSSIQREACEQMTGALPLTDWHRSVGAQGYLIEAWISWGSRLRSTHGKTEEQGDHLLLLLLFASAGCLRRLCSLLLYLLKAGARLSSLNTATKTTTVSLKCERIQTVGVTYLHPSSAVREGSWGGHTFLAHPSRARSCPLSKKAPSSSGTLSRA